MLMGKYNFDLATLKCYFFKENGKYPNPSSIKRHKIQDINWEIPQPTKKTVTMNQKNIAINNTL